MGSDDETVDEPPPGPPDRGCLGWLPIPTDVLDCTCLLLTLVGAVAGVVWVLRSRPG